MAKHTMSMYQTKDAMIEAMQAEIDSLEAQLVEERNIIKQIVDKAFTTYEARNGRNCGIEDDSGEMCYIVPHEPIVAAINAMKGCE